MHRYLMLAGLALAPALSFAQDARGTFVGADGSEIGSARLTQTEAGGVLIEIDVASLPADSWVGFHIHETGVCDHGAGHESAGGHFNPMDTQHGLLMEGGPHAGDMPNVWVDSEGMARAQVFNPFVTLEQGDALIRGRALMIHAGPDDHVTQPSGGAGDRLACAVIE